MLHPKNNRIDYGDQLIPPDGYELEQAIGTSYSLDLEALMILPVALFYSQKLDGSVDKMRYDMLHAITEAAKKITIYYQNGQLKVPQKYHHLMAYWEKGIQPVTMPHHASSFHPKIWVIRYEGKGLAPKYRVLVTSRNLTFSRDWDMAFATDGEVSDKEQPKNKPLVHFLQYLNTTGKKTIPAAFLNDLLKVKFDLPEKFDAFKFVPIGIPNIETGKPYTNPITVAKALWDEMLIVSPFIDKTTLDSIYKATTKTPYLLSRKEELDSVDEETLSLFDCWQFSTFFQQAEYFQELEDDGTPPLAQSLHAKLVVAMQDSVPYWYLGSANCSDPAQGRNIEFMVELKAGNWAGLKTKDIFKALTDPAKSEGITLFTPYTFEARVSVEEQKSIDLAIRKIKYDLTQLPIKGTAVLIEGGTAYDLSIEIDASHLTLPKGFEVKVKPLPENQKAGEAIKPEKINRIDNFGGYGETALSIFLVVEIAKDRHVHSQFLLPMEIELPNSRLNKIFSAIIDSREKFLKYLTFLLTGEETDLIGNANGKKDKKSGTGHDAWAFTGTPVYEKLLIASSRFPDKLKSIDTLIQRLKAETTESDEPIITAEFEGFWNVFQTFIKNKN
jgi:hypothetical protein